MNLQRLPDICAKIAGWFELRVSQQRRGEQVAETLGLPTHRRLVEDVRIASWYRPPPAEPSARRALGGWLRSPHPNSLAITGTRWPGVMKASAQEIRQLLSGEGWVA